MFSKIFGSGSSGPSGTTTTHPDVGKEYTIGKYCVTVQALIAKGGFAQVFLVVDEAGQKYALKKVRMCDQEALDTTTREVTIMKDLSGHKNIVNLFASDVRPSGRYTECLILMEYCPAGHVVDIMNKRLARPFDESEVLKIFSDISLGVAALHLQKEPMIHRDIKLENVLLGPQHSSFKLCDFGSATNRILIPGTTHPVSDVEEEIQKYTTLPYRAPEMVDLYSHKPIDTKSDIWALGCVLFKLMFFEDAFQESKLSILSAKYKVPEEHKYSDAIMSLLRGMLEPDSDRRLDISAVVQKAFQLRNLPSPLGMTTPKKSAPSKPAAQQSTHSKPTIKSPVREDSFESIRAPSTRSPSRSPATTKRNPFDSIAATSDSNTATPSKDDGNWAFTDNSSKTGSLTGPRRARPRPSWGTNPQNSSTNSMVSIIQPPAVSDPTQRQKSSSPFSPLGGSQSPSQSQSIQSSSSSSFPESKHKNNPFASPPPVSPSLSSTSSTSASSNPFDKVEVNSVDSSKTFKSAGDAFMDNLLKASPNPSKSDTKSPFT
eukprot:m.88748 g.88748  ORF g.88748 m.88748 type:complete len:544 (-) comp21474_c0_seq2:22-1653(-)